MSPYQSKNKKTVSPWGCYIPEEYGIVFYLSSAGITQFRFKGSPPDFSGELSGLSLPQDI
jgi:hypothetical protein